jgi:hypothetical protein
MVTKENCVHMGLRGTSEWNDRGCDLFKHSFICEPLLVYAGKHYHFVDQNVTYDQAVEECKSFGKLFEPKDLETNKKVYEAAVQAMGKSSIWIGVNNKATEDITRLITQCHFGPGPFNFNYT